MKDKKIDSKDVLELDYFELDTKTAIIEQIKKYKFVTREMIRKNLGFTDGLMNTAIKQLVGNGIIKSERRLIKYKGDNNHHNAVGYFFPTKK